MPVHQAMADRLMSKSGKDFDEAYMDLMETAHKLDIALFEVKSNRAENPSVQGPGLQDAAHATLPLQHGQQAGEKSGLEHCSNPAAASTSCCIKVKPRFCARAPNRGFVFVSFAKHLPRMLN
jgi:predicted outer membrane protein